MKKKILIGLAAVAALLVTWDLVMTCRSYTYTPVQLPKTFDEFYAQKLAKSRELGVRANNEEKLIRFAEKTPVALLYIHGYGASRAEGELVMERIARDLKANTYFLRLPGHGINVEAHALATAKDHLDEAITTIDMMHRLGDKVVVVGTSMGGIIATYIAANYPDKLDALVLVSPFYQFGSASAKLTNFYPTFKLLTAVMPRRPSRPIPKEADNWSLYWYPNQYMKSLRQLVQLRNLASRDSVYERVTKPVLLLYYYKDAENSDHTADVNTMLEAYGTFNNGTPDPLSRKVCIEKGNHVLMSRFEEVDYDAVQKAVVDYVRSMNWQ
ncbi:MAG: alpha/beta fold hydrolase [Spirochaetes bacterium]|nr:alpha/beta fold hydrolase [Spirochaetota bacterium]